MRPGPRTTRFARVAADQASAVPSRATQQDQRPVDDPRGAGLEGLAELGAVGEVQDEIVTHGSLLPAWCLRPFPVGRRLDVRGTRGGDRSPVVVAWARQRAQYRPSRDQQLPVRPLLHDPALVQDVDQVRVLDRAQPVGDQHHRLARQGGLQALLDRPLGGGVEVAGRLVEDQDLRPPQQRPGDRQPLPLAAREVGPALADDRLVPLRQARDELVQPGRAGRLRSPPRASPPAGPGRCSPGACR